MRLNAASTALVDFEVLHAGVHAAVLDGEATRGRWTAQYGPAFPHPSVPASIKCLVGELREISLVSDGKTELVLQMRYADQGTMRTDLVAAVEMLIGRAVTAFLSDNHIDPDIAIESFVPEPRTNDRAVEIPA